MLRYDCKVSLIEHMRLPGMYRVHTKCGDNVECVLEMHEKLMNIAEKDSLAIILTTKKKECLENDFCGRGHVVSVKKINEMYRVIVSIAGILVVLNLKETPRSPLKVMNEVYIGVSKK